MRGYFFRLKEGIKYLPVLLLLFFSCKKNTEQPPPPGSFQLEQIQIGSVILNLSQQNTSIPVDQPMVITFSDSLDVTSVPKAVFLLLGNDTIPITFSFTNENKIISAKPTNNLQNNAGYILQIN